MGINENLLYAILEWRDSVDTSGGIAPPEMSGWTRDQVCYHAELCRERGWLRSYKGFPSGTGRVPEILQCLVGRLTISGSNELQRMRATRQPEVSE